MTPEFQFAVLGLSMGVVMLGVLYLIGRYFVADVDGDEQKEKN
ncbi:MAG: hypothetical protein AAFV62_08980 [Pseudomonadota bacterium]